MICAEMQKALSAYGEVLRLVRRLPKDTRPYYAKYARENFVNYREVDSGDTQIIQELLHRTYAHSLWVLNKVIRGHYVRTKFKPTSKYVDLRTALNLTG